MHGIYEEICQRRVQQLFTYAWHNLTHDISDDIQTKTCRKPVMSGCLDSHVCKQIAFLRETAMGTMLAQDSCVMMQDGLTSALLAAVPRRTEVNTDK